MQDVCVCVCVCVSVGGCSKALTYTGTIYVDP